MDRYTDSAFETHEPAPLAIAEPAEEPTRPRVEIRAGLVLRCKTLIEDGLYESEARLDAAVDKLAEELG